jgi:hypothetical protein
MARVRVCLGWAAMAWVGCNGGGSGNESPPPSASSSSSSSSSSSASSSTGGASSSLTQESSSQVVAGCDGGCEADATCCGNACVNVATTALHCGGCGQPCAAGSYCVASACLPGTLANLCATTNGVLLLDGVMVDDAAGQSVGESLTAACAPFALTVGAISDAAFAAGAPRLPVVRAERLVVTVGGPAVNPVVSAYETGRLAPLYFDFNAINTQRIIRVAGTGQVVLNVLDAGITRLHDYFLVETFLEPAGNRLILLSYGLGSAGTEAAALFIQDPLLSSPVLQTHAWVIVEWLDDTGDGVTAGDTFTVVATGP